MQKRAVIHKGHGIDPNAPGQTHCCVCAKPLRDREDFIAIEHAGNRYTVCCPSCQARFEMFPSLYLFDNEGHQKGTS